MHVKNIVQNRVLINQYFLIRFFTCGSFLRNKNVQNLLKSYQNVVALYDIQMSLQEI